MVKTLLIASIGLYASLTLAQSCSYIDLTEKGQIYEGIPIYDQSGSQICYAFSASQLMEGERVLRGHRYSQDEAINPFSLALRYAISKGDKNLQAGGVPCRAIEFARQNGICPKDKSFKSAEEIDALAAEFTACKKGSKKHCSEMINSIGEDEAFLVISQENPLIYARAVEDQTCQKQDKIRMNIPACDYVNDESVSSQNFKKLVDKVFDSKRPRPVEIGYSMKIFNYDAVANMSYKIKRVVEPDVFVFSTRYKPHSSILLGRRTAKNGKCQYLLRNTQGSSFCPMGIAQKLGWECTRNGIWINQAELFDSTFQISSIKQD